jgi:hypothetical protein
VEVRWCINKELGWWGKRRILLVDNKDDAAEDMAWRMIQVRSLGWYGG